MDQKINWSRQADASLEKLLRYLVETEGSEYADRYRDFIQSRLTQAAKYPDSGMPSQQRPGIRRYILDKYNYAIYSIVPGGILVRDIMHYKMNKRGF